MRTIKSFVEEARELAVSSPRSTVFMIDGKIVRVKKENNEDNKCRVNGEIFNPFSKGWWKK